MLDRVGDVDILPRYAGLIQRVLPRYAGLIQRVLEQPPGRTYEGNALAILDVTGLLANQG
jgi:hypothetical protein